VNLWIGALPRQAVTDLTLTDTNNAARIAGVPDYVDSGFLDRVQVKAVQRAPVPISIVGNPLEWKRVDCPVAPRAYVASVIRDRNHSTLYAEVGVKCR
jgi:hypothetical protein